MSRPVARRFGFSDRSSASRLNRLQFELLLFVSRDPILQMQNPFFSAREADLFFVGSRLLRRVRI